MSGFDRTAPGEIVLLDGNLPSLTKARGLHMLSVRIGRHLIEPALGKGVSVHGRILRPPECLVLFDYIASLIRWTGDS